MVFKKTEPRAVLSISIDGFQCDNNALYASMVEVFTQV
jgi:hypothetical protein